jgi:argininosuccinate lyase
MPFREAHETVGRAVMHAIDRGCELEDLPLEALRQFTPLIEPDVFEALSVKNTLASKSQAGGTSPVRVAEALAAARERLQQAMSGH